MSWNLRLQQMIMAGGVFSFAACGGGSGLGHQPTSSTGGSGGADATGGTGGGTGGGGAGGTPDGFTIPCGNANPDPCICGRAGNSPNAEQSCHACQSSGGQWLPTVPSCVSVETPIAVGGGDGAAGANGMGDAAVDGGETAPVTTPYPLPIGNALPDPCFSERLADGPSLQVCQACGANGGYWQPATSTQPARCLGGHDAAATDAASDPGDDSSSHG
jgi:hypothetical protein